MFWLRASPRGKHDVRHCVTVPKRETPRPGSPSHSPPPWAGLRLRSTQGHLNSILNLSCRPQCLWEVGGTHRRWGVTGRETEGSKRSGRYMLVIQNLNITERHTVESESAQDFMPQRPLLLTFPHTVFWMFFLCIHWPQLLLYVHIFCFQNSTHIKCIPIHDLFKQSPPGGHLGCFLLRDIVPAVLQTLQL